MPSGFPPRQQHKTYAIINYLIGGIMDYRYIINNLTQSGYTIIISPSLHGSGIDLQINDSSDEMVCHEPFCNNIEAGLLETNSQIELRS
jgi:hypothetical protein